MSKSSSKGYQFTIQNGLVTQVFEIKNGRVKEKGIDFYLGHILKESEIKYEEKKKNDELKKIEEKPLGNPDLILQNPGVVSYADIQAYMEKKRQERYNG